MSQQGNLAVFSLRDRALERELCFLTSREPNGLNEIQFPEGELAY